MTTPSMSLKWRMSKLLRKTNTDPLDWIAVITMVAQVGDMATMLEWNQLGFQAKLQVLAWATKANSVMQDWEAYLNLHYEENANAFSQDDEILA